MFLVFGWIVFDVITPSVPPLQCVLSFLFAVEQWAHTMVVQTVWFVKVSDVESVNLSLSRVGDPEVEPLRKLAWAPMVKLHF